MKIDIPQYAEVILERLHQNGFEASIVGGCVRDSLLGLTPNDYDITTNALPNQTEAALDGFRIIETGLKHGTVTILSDGNPIEITTYRSDGEYLGHRKPEKVQFEKDLSEDLKRRDFTINAMTYSEESGLTDLFGGLSDLDHKLIRCVGNPQKRFDEDALRILRCLRFASVLGFDIEESTAEQCHKMSQLLKEISAERIAVELEKLLCGKNCLKVLTEYRDIISVIIPELSPCFDFPQNTPHHCYDVYSHICHSVENIQPSWQLRMTMLLHDIGKPFLRTTDENGIDHFKQHQFKSAELAKDILKRLKLDKKSSLLIYNLIYEHDNRVLPQKKYVRRFIAKHGYDFTLDYIKVRFADTSAQSDYHRKEKLHDIAEIKRLTEELHAENAVMKISDLAVNGNDMISVGFCGTEISKALNTALEAILEDKISNTKEDILKYVKENS